MHVCMHAGIIGCENKLCDTLGLGYLACQGGVGSQIPAYMSILRESSSMHE
jgi:hypothetical protein